MIANPGTLRSLVLHLFYSAIFGCFLSPVAAHAQRITLQSFGSDEGLSNHSIYCLNKDQAGFLYACTEHGIYFYDGTRFRNLGPAQGLPDGGFIQSLAFGEDGTMYLRYGSRVYVSKSASPVTRPLALRFAPSLISRWPVGPSLSEGDPGNITAWRQGAVFSRGGRLFYVRPNRKNRPSQIVPLQIAFAGLPALPTDVVAVFSNAGLLWTARSNGEVCAISSIKRRCYGQAAGLANEAWTVFLADGPDAVFVRSPLSLAHIDFRTGNVLATRLPFQGGAYLSTPTFLYLARGRDGQLITQASDGLIIETGGQWTHLSSRNGFPNGPITNFLYDRNDGLWLTPLGQGVQRAVGFGVFENLDSSDGLSADLVWQIASVGGGASLIATNSGIDVLNNNALSVLADRHNEHPVYTMLADAPDHVWAAVGPSGVESLSLSIGKFGVRLSSVNTLDLPLTFGIVATRDRTWFLTSNGIFYLEARAASGSKPTRLMNVSGQFVAGVSGPDGDLWALDGEHLVHIHKDGSVVYVNEDWEGLAYEPLSIGFDKLGRLWIAGNGGGVFRIELDGDRVVTQTRITTPDLPSSTALALRVDSRGYVWVGTDSGISVFNGKNWTSANVHSGLVWNDLSENGISEAPDGSMWFATSRGLSRLLQPAALFDRSHLHPVISDIRIGGSPMPNSAVPFSRDPVTIEFGSLDFSSKVEFHYQLEGVDAGWGSTNQGEVRYPSIPPGHHRFEVFAYDPLTHQTSEPVSVLLRMRKPWWLWWPMQALYVAAALTLLYGIMRLRYLYLLRQQRVLHEEVELRTREIRAAQAQLVLQATRDSLTSLLTRGEVQTRLIDALTRVDDQRHVTVGLLDIDHFKRINDQLGHIAGDEILIEMGRRLRVALAPDEDAGRYGGEEILIVTHLSAAEGIARINELSRAVCSMPFSLDHGPVSVTCSIGVAQARLDDDWRSLIRRADRALYLAKAQGRARIVEAEDAA